jgi:hypothetical protein
MIDQYTITDDVECVLPIGLYRNGKYHRKVVIDEWLGVDQERLTSKSARQNPARAMNAILQRLIQSVEGVMETKSDRFHLCSESVVDSMFASDRDYLIIQAFAVSGENEQSLDLTCPHCNAELVEDIDLLNFKVSPHDESVPPYFDFVLPRGLKINDTLVTKGRFNFPTGKDQKVYSKDSGAGEFAIFSSMLAQCVSDLNGDIKRLTKELTQRMSLKDRKFLMKKLGEVVPGVDTDILIDCASCGKNFHTPLDISRFFF